MYHGEKNADHDQYLHLSPSPTRQSGRRHTISYKKKGGKAAVTGRTRRRRGRAVWADDSRSRNPRDGRWTPKAIVDILVCHHFFIILKTERTLSVRSHTGLWDIDGMTLFECRFWRTNWMRTRHDGVAIRPQVDRIRGILFKNQEVWHRQSPTNRRRCCCCVCVCVCVHCSVGIAEEKEAQWIVNKETATIQDLQLLLSSVDCCLGSRSSRHVGFPPFALLVKTYRMSLKKRPWHKQDSLLRAPSWCYSCAWLSLPFGNRTGQHMPSQVATIESETRSILVPDVPSSQRHLLSTKVGPLRRNKKHKTRSEQ